jgi:1-acyl-sn-glycerol-3-phosphate acyltransferase
LRVLGNGRSLLGFLLLILLFVAGGVLQRLVFWPLCWVPAWRYASANAFMKGMSFFILLCARIGGARLRRAGRIPTARPALIVMNHQSLLDIPTVVLMGDPVTPWFVTRTRYRRAPVVGLAAQDLDAPFIEPKDGKGALRALKEAARRQPHGILIFPEGHRTRDGSVQEFHPAGLQTMLRERPVPVYLVVTDGFWRCRRFVDFVWHMHTIDGRTEVLGPFTPPASPSEIPAFVEGLRTTLVERLAALREGRPAA